MRVDIECLENEEVRGGRGEGRVPERRMRQALSDMVRARRRVPLQRLLSFLQYNLAAKRARVEDGAELGEKLGNRMDEARVKLSDDSKNDALWLWRQRGIEDNA